MNSKETIIVVALVGLALGYLSRLVTEPEDKEAEVAVADEPIHIQRDVGSVSQVMTDTALSSLISLCVSPS